jgi:hypothetical protein
MTHPVDGPSALEAALWYAQNWRALVAPADPLEKKPLIATGKDHAEHSSSDPAVIRSWSAWKRPGVRVAVITGPKSGVLLLDADQHTPEIDGVESLAALEQRLGPLPELTPRARTAHGLHVTLGYPDGAVIRNSASTLAPGVDVRGAGGLFIAPPAPDRAWLAEAHPEDTPLAALPTAWAEALAGAAPGAGSASHQRPPGARIPKGQRHATLYSHAGRLRRFGHTEAEILALLRTMNAARCDPPLEDGELVEMARDASRYTPAPTLLNAGDQHLPRITAAAWEAVAFHNTPPFLFVMGTNPVRLEATPDGATAITALNERRLCHALALAAVWHRKATRPPAKAPALAPGDPCAAIPKGHVPALPPPAVVRNMLACPSPPLPVLTRVVRAPILAPDGTLATAEGYHGITRTYYAPTPGFEVPPVAEAPSDEDIERARALILDDLLGDFPFVGDAERAHAVALLLLPFVRELIDGPTPLHLIEKPAPGTGASLLADVLLFPFVGGPTPTMSEGRDEEEWRKRLLAILLTGPSVVLLDNLRYRLDSSALSSCMTSTVWTDRRLGVNEMVVVPVRCAWCATGNNPPLSNEIARRTIRIRLDAKQDRPWLREGFRHPNLRAWVAEHRGELVWAALTFARAWVAAGQPASREVLGMFDAWAATVGGILEMVCIPGFLSNLTELYDASDAEGAAWRSLVEVWWETHRAREVTAGDLWRLVNPPDGEPIPLDVGQGTERSQHTRFGFLLMKQRDRQFGKYRVVKVDGTKHGAQLWRLDLVGEGPP